MSPKAARKGAVSPKVTYERLEIDGRLPPSSARQAPVRAGRGKASRRGRKCGKGDKGAGQRSRGWNKFGVMGGGQNPFYRMHPKIGFVSARPRRKVVSAVRLVAMLGGLGKALPQGPVTLATLRACGAISEREEARASQGRLSVRVLGAPVGAKGKLSFEAPVGSSASARGL